MLQDRSQHQFRIDGTAGGFPRCGPKSSRLAGRRKRWRSGRPQLLRVGRRDVAVAAEHADPQRSVALDQRRLVVGSAVVVRLASAKPTHSVFCEAALTRDADRCSPRRRVLAVRRALKLRTFFSDEQFEGLRQKHGCPFCHDYAPLSAIPRSGSCPHWRSQDATRALEQDYSNHGATSDALSNLTHNSLLCLT